MIHLQSVPSRWQIADYQSTERNYLGISNTMRPGRKALQPRTSVEATAAAERNSSHSTLALVQPGSP